MKLLKLLYLQQLLTPAGRYARLRAIKTALQRMRLRNHDFSLITNNCLGGMVLHDLHQPFNTPIVNMWISAPDYVEFLTHLESYLVAPVEDITATDDPYPIGLLRGKVKLQFMHYSTFAEAEAAWRRRAERVRLDNLYVAMVERDGCTPELLRRFDELPYKHKVALVHRSYPWLKSGFTVKECVEPEQVGLLTDNCGHGSRYYDQYPWTQFLNSR